MGIAHDTRWLDAYDQVALVRSGQLSPSELVDAAIERIEADGHNAVIRATFADARHTAAAATIAAAPMAGLPFLMKDLWAATEGQVATDGNAALKALPAPAYATDSVLVGRWRAAGVSFAGRTNTPEFGLLPTTEPDAFGPTLNPWDRTRSPGGSSGGAAAAVAAGLVPVAHASDGGGSIRIPASCCGLVGLKPSQGRISAGPGEGDEAGLGVQLVVSRSVRDTAWFLDLAAGPGVGDTIVAAPPTRPYVDEVGADPGSLRIGFLAHSPRGELHPDGRAAVEHTAALLASLGHRVEAANPPILDSDEYLRPFSAMWSSNTGLNLRRLSEQLGRPATADDVEPLTWALGQRAGRFSGTDLAASLAAAVRCSAPAAGVVGGRRVGPAAHAHGRRPAAEARGDGHEPGGPDQPVPLLGWVRRVHLGVQHQPPARHQPADALERAQRHRTRRPARRRAARGRLRQGRRPDPRGRPARVGRPLGPPPPAARLTARPAARATWRASRRRPPGSGRS